MAAGQEQSMNEELPQAAITRRLIWEQQTDLGKPVTEDEVKDAMFSLEDNKAPGPHGFDALFFKKVLQVIGNYIIGTPKKKQTKQTIRKSFLVLWPTKMISDTKPAKLRNSSNSNAMFSGFNFEGVECLMNLF